MVVYFIVNLLLNFRFSSSSIVAQIRQMLYNIVIFKYGG